jgi:exonuclease VII large subunit
LRRGYSITRIAGDNHALTSLDGLSDGTQLETIIASGKILSTINHTQQP